MSAAGDAIGHLGFLSRDAASDQILGGLVAGLMTVAERSHEVAFGAPGVPGGLVLTDPGAAPLWALEHAALYTGGAMPTRRPGEGDNDFLGRARVAVVSPTGMLSGSRGAAIAAAQARLTGSRSLIFRERWEGALWRVLMVTSPSETPDAAGLVAAVQDVMPAGVRVLHEVRDERDWQEVLDAHGVWIQVKTNNATWMGVRDG